MGVTESTEGRQLFCDPPLPVTLIDTTQLGLERAISGAGLRQTAIASNLANANTPGYRRVDVDFHSALSRAMSDGDSESVESVQFSTEADPQSLRADGNGVDVDVEAANMAKNGLEYEALVSVAKARLGILKSAMGVA
jgi:flagellar basal-body rod protein FlgB